MLLCIHKLYIFIQDRLIAVLGRLVMQWRALTSPGLARQIRLLSCKAAPRFLLRVVRFCGGYIPLLVVLISSLDVKEC